MLEPGLKAFGVGAALLALLALPFAADAEPERIPSFGPNGTHWPEKIPTPFLYDNTVANIIEVPCSWSAIKSAIQGVTANQANSGTLILVRPGELAGNGSRKRGRLDRHIGVG